MSDVRWGQGVWSAEPVSAVVDGGHLLVTARESSDLWRTTSYGFVHDDAHGLLVDMPDGTAVEVGFVLDFDQQFDQPGCSSVPTPSTG